MHRACASMRVRACVRVWGGGGGEGEGGGKTQLPPTHEIHYDLHSHSGLTLRRPHWSVSGRQDGGRGSGRGGGGRHRHPDHPHCSPLGRWRCSPGGRQASLSPWRGRERTGRALHKSSLFFSLTIKYKYCLFFSQESSKGICFLYHFF